MSRPSFTNGKETYIVAHVTFKPGGDMRREGNVVVIVIIVVAMAFSLFLIIPFGGRVGLFREATISFLFRKPPRFISLEVSVNKMPYTIKAGNALKIRGDETLVINTINANTFFGRYLTVDIAGFGKPNDLHEPLQTSEIRKQLLEAGIKSIPIDVYYIDRLIAKVPIEIEIAEDDFMKRLAKAQDVNEKIALLRSAYATFPENNYFLDSLDALLSEKGNYEALVGIYKSILDKDPENAKALERLSTYYIKLHLFDEALAINKKIVEQGKPTTSTYRHMAYIAGEQGNLSERIIYLEKAHELDKGNEEIILDLGKSYEDRGEKAKTMDLYRSAVGTAKKKEVLVPVIQDALQRKDYKEAEPLLKRYISLYPSDKNAVAQLGQLMGNIGDPKAQIAYYQKALALSPHDPVIMYNLAVSYDKAGNEKEALKTYTMLLKVKPDDTDALSRAALLSLKLGRNADAYTYYASLTRKKGTKENLKGLVSAAVALRDEDRIIEACKRYLKIGKDYDVAMSLGYAYEAKAAAKKGREKAKLLNDALNAYTLAKGLNPSSDKAQQKYLDTKIEIMRLMKYPS
jgi:tetratricopeptide (TPR) repeat protein